jgi:ABC-2 type transport system permease protein
MNPRRALAITGRLLSQFRHDRRTLAILFVTPLIVLGLFAALFRNDAPPPALGVVQLDDGALGPALAKQLAASDLVDAMQMTEAEAIGAMVEGDLAGYVVLPEGFSTAASTGSLRPHITLEGTDQQSTIVIQQAVQGAALAAVRELAAGAPPGGPAASVPELDPQVAYRYGGGELDALDLLGGPFIGMLVFFLVYVVTSVSFLRERSLGTLERLMASPLRRTEIVVGYMLGFGLVAVVQAAEVLAFGLLVLGLYNAGDIVLIFGIEVLLALAAVNLGIFLSTFARNEFQAVQFIPLIVVPQVLLSGIIVPVAAEPDWLQAVSNVLPLTYAVDGLRDIMLRGADLGAAGLQLDFAVVGGFCLAVIIAAAATLRRQVA